MAFVLVLRFVDTQVVADVANFAELAFGWLDNMILLEVLLLQQQLLVSSNLFRLDHREVDRLLGRNA